MSETQPQLATVWCNGRLAPTIDWPSSATRSVGACVDVQCGDSLWVVRGNAERKGVASSGTYSAEDTVIHLPSLLPLRSGDTTTCRCLRGTFMQAVSMHRGVQYIVGKGGLCNCKKYKLIYSLCSPPPFAAPLAHLVSPPPLYPKVLRPPRWARAFLTYSYRAAKVQYTNPLCIN